MTARKGWIALIAGGIGLALIITLFSPFASSNPDGLERVAEDKDFLHHAEGPSFEIIPDYAVPGIHNERLATILSGIIGVLIVAVIGLAVGFGLKRLAASRAEPTHSNDTSSTAPPG